MRRGWLGERLRNDLFCVEWNVKPRLSQSVDMRSLNATCLMFRILWSACVRASSTPVNAAEMVEPIEMPFGGEHSHVGLRNHIVDMGHIDTT